MFVAHLTGRQTMQAVVFRAACVLALAVFGAACDGDESPGGPTPFCEYSLSPAGLVLHWHQTGGQVNLTAREVCAWTVSAGADWLTITSPTQGAGSDVISFTNSIYTAENSRSAPVNVRGLANPGHSVWVSQEGCRYGSETNREVGAIGGSVSMLVFGDPISQSCPIGCPWTAISLAPWIDIVSSMPRAGDDQVTYTVDANTTGQERIGQIRIETRLVTVLQRGS